MLLQSEPRAVQLARDSLPDRDHEAGAEEDSDLAEVDLLTRVVVPRRTEDHEPHVLLELLELRTQVERLGVLDGQLVQAEALADLRELLGRRLEEPQPDEAALAAARGRLLQLH